MATSRAPIDGNATAGSQEWTRTIDEIVNKIEIRWVATAGGATNRSSHDPIIGQIKKISYSAAGSYILTDEDQVSIFAASPASSGASYISTTSSGGNTDFPRVVCGHLNLSITNGGAAGTGTVLIYLE